MGMDKIFCMIMNVSAGRSATARQCKSISEDVSTSVLRKH